MTPMFHFLLGLCLLSILGLDLCLYKRTIVGAAICAIIGGIASLTLLIISGRLR